MSLIWRPIVPSLPSAITNLRADDRLRQRAEDAWRQAHVLRQAIPAWIEWTRAQQSLGRAYGDSVARAGAAAIETLRGLHVNSPAFVGDDDPEYPGPASWWPQPPSESIDPSYYDAANSGKDFNMDFSARDEITRSNFALGNVLLPELNRLVSVLEQSPHAALSSTPLRPLVELRGIGQKPIVLQKEVEPLSEPKYRVIEALLAAGPDGLTTPELVKVKGDAVKYLRELRRNPAWKKAIRMAGGPWQRYSVVHR